MLLSVSVPVRASDATRCEALGPVLISLLLSVLNRGYICFKGDSKYVCGLLDSTYRSDDVQLYNCSEIVRDVLSNWWLHVTWIPREQNSRCDLLAR